MILRYALSILLVGGLLGCKRGMVGGNPTLAAASTNGTSRVMEATEAQVGAAITNAFDYLAYHEMLFVPVDPSWGSAVTNGFELLHGLQAASTVPLSNGKSLPYDADFYISVRSVSSNRTAVTVRTTHASVRDGEERGVHGGWAIHPRKVAPVQREEDNVLAAISEQLKKK